MMEFEGSVGARRHAPYAPQLWQTDEKTNHKQQFEKRKLEQELKKVEVVETFFGLS